MTNAGAKDFLDEFRPQTKNTVVICPPFTALTTVGAADGFAVGAQNMHYAENGAYTGEVSAEMLVELGVGYVLVGHSERRTKFVETDEFVINKAKAAISNEIVPVVCVGETKEEYQSGKTKDILSRQLSGLGQLDGEFIVAYEPVWAIGTGLVPTMEEIADIHVFIRGITKAPILYGGSVTDKNAGEIMAIPNVDGVLVGGAALCPNKFTGIINAAN